MWDKADIEKKLLLECENLQKQIKDKSEEI